jgi:hypothetical protein
MAGSSLGRIWYASWNFDGVFDVAESVGRGCILDAIMAGTRKAHKIHMKSLPDLEGQESHVFFQPFC